MKNAFTGEPLVRTDTSYEAKRKAGIKQRELELAEIIQGGEREKPKGRGRIYDIPPDNGTYCEDQVDQTGAGATDINAIMKRIDPSGKAFNQAILSNAHTEAGMFYGDFTDAQTLQESLNIVKHAEEQFQTLDADLRNRFENDPVKFMQYIHDPAKLEEQYALGLRKKPVVPEPETTLKDVERAIRETAKPSKKASKGEDSDG